MKYTSTPDHSTDATELTRYTEDTAPGRTWSLSFTTPQTQENEAIRTRVGIRYLLVAVQLLDGDLHRAK